MAVSVTLSLVPARRTWAQLQAGIYVDYAITGGSLPDPSYALAFAPHGQPAGRSPTVVFTARSGSGGVELSPSLSTIPWSTWPPTGSVYDWDIVLVDDSSGQFTELARTQLWIDIVDLSLPQSDYLHDQLQAGIYLDYQILTPFAPGTYAIAFAPSGGAVSLSATVPFPATSGSGGVLLDPSGQTLPWSTWPPAGNCYNWNIVLGVMPSPSQLNPMSQVALAIATAALSLAQTSYTKAQLAVTIDLRYQIVNQLPTGTYVLSFVPHGTAPTTADTVPFAPRSGSGTTPLNPSSEVLPWSSWPPTGNCYDWDIVLCQSTGPLFELGRVELQIVDVTLALAQPSYTQPQLGAGIYLNYQIAGDLPAGTYVLSFVPHGNAPTLADTVPFAPRSGSGAVMLDPQTQTLPWSTWPPTGNCYAWDIVLCSQSGQALTEVTRVEILIAAVTLSLASPSFWPTQLQAGIFLDYVIQNDLPAGTYVLSFVPHGGAPSLADTVPFPPRSGSGAVTLNPQTRTLPWSTWPPTGNCYDWDMVLCSQSGGALAELTRIELQIVSITLSLAQPAYSRAQLAAGLTVAYAITSTLPAATYVLAFAPHGGAPSLDNTVPFTPTSGSGNIVLSRGTDPNLPWATWPPTGNCYDWDIVAGSLVAPTDFTPRAQVELLIVEIPTITALSYDGADVKASWTANAQPGFSTYQMQLQYPSGPPTTVTPAQPTGTISASGLAGTNVVVAAAVVSGVNSGWSAPVTVVDLTPVLGSIATTVPRAGSYNVTATWGTLAPAIVTGYAMQVIDSTGQVLGSSSVTASPATVADLNLVAPGPYYVRVQGTNGLSVGPFCTQSSVLFQIPGGLQLYYDGTKLVASWDALPGPPTYTYTVELYAGDTMVESHSQSGVGPVLIQPFTETFHFGSVYTAVVSATLGIATGPWSAPAQGPYSRATVYQFDRLGRLHSIAVTGGADVVYTLDDLGNVNTVTAQPHQS
jgi:hypothetical protein